MYTIEELESIVSEGSNAVDITDIVDQLLDTMREAARYRAALEYIEDGTLKESPVVDMQSASDGINWAWWRAGTIARTALKDDA